MRSDSNDSVAPVRGVAEEGGAFIAAPSTTLDAPPLR